MAFVLPLHEAAGAIFIDFDCNSCSPSKQFACKYSSTSACEKSQLIHATAPAGPKIAATAQSRDTWRMFVLKLTV